MTKGVLRTMNLPSTPASDQGDLEPVTALAAGDLLASVQATNQHIALLLEREQRLAKARDEAQAQMFHRIGSAHRCGEIDDYQLLEIFEALRTDNVPGSRKHWDASVERGWLKMKFLRGQLPNGPAGSWVGPNPCGRTDPAPTEGISVVYVLFDERNGPCYVGSTDNLRQRIKAHARDGKRFVRWQAHRCQDREHAYQLEEQLLQQNMPYLNRRQGR